MSQNRSLRGPVFPQLVTVFTLEGLWEWRVSHLSHAHQLGIRWLRETQSPGIDGPCETKATASQRNGSMAQGSDRHGNGKSCWGDVDPLKMGIFTDFPMPYLLKKSSHCQSDYQTIQLNPVVRAETSVHKATAWSLHWYVARRLSPAHLDVEWQLNFNASVELLPLSFLRNESGNVCLTQAAHLKNEKCSALGCNKHFQGIQRVQVCSAGGWPCLYQANSRRPRLLWQEIGYL